MADTITPYLGLTVPEIGTTGYAPKINTDLSLIDTAFGTKLARVVANGSQGSGSLSLALPSAGVASYRLIIDNMTVASDNTAVFARISNDSGLTYLSGASDYEYARRDLSNQSTGTQALDASAAASAILLTPATLKSANVATAPRHRLIIDIVSAAYNTNTNYDLSLSAMAFYRTAAGYRARSEVAAGVVGTYVSPITNIRIGGVLAGNYAQNLALNYTLYALPGFSL